MKRKYGASGGLEENAISIYGAPPLESTMMIDTGGKASGATCIGNLSSIPVNASMSSGSRVFQYNRFFWNDDLFTFDYENCCVYLAIACADYGRGRGRGRSNLTFYPIYLPRGTMTMLQSLQSGVTFDPDVKKYMIDEVLYYLNGAFTDFGADSFTFAGPESLNVPPTSYLKGSPSIYSYNYKGYMPSPVSHNTRFPIFSNDASPPPLQFIYQSSNGQIALVRNPAYWNNPVLSANRDIAFQYVQPLREFTNSDGNPTNDITLSNGTITPIHTSVNFPDVFTNTGNENNKGWTSRGAFSLGIAPVQSTDTPDTFTDVYQTNAARHLLFQQTTFPGKNDRAFASPADFDAFCTQWQLQKFILTSRYICNLLPSRFITIESDILTRDQKLMPISNNPILSRPSLMGIQFLTLDALRTLKDNTLSGTLPSNISTGAIGGRTNGQNDTTVSHLNPFYSMQSIDFEIYDEFGSILENYRSAESNYNLVYAGGGGGFGIPQFTGNGVFGVFETEYGFNGDQSATSPYFPIPAWLLAQNPSTIAGNVQPLLASFCTYNTQPLYMLYLNPSSPNPQFNVPVDFGPNMPISGNIIHFGRVLGF